MDQRRVVQVEDVVRLMVEAFADKPEDVSVLALETASGIHFTLSVAGTQAGKLLGKSGRSARAMRTILTLIGHKNRETYSLDIVPLPPDPI